MGIRVLSKRPRRIGTTIAGAAAVCALAAGCGPLEPDSSPLATQRAGYVDLMLSSAYSGGPGTEQAAMAVIAQYGGGYVTSAVLTGAGGTPSEKLTLDAVIGAGSVTGSMQGETNSAPSYPHCYIITVGYYDTEYTDKQTACPSTLTTAAAQQTAQRQIAAQTVSENYDAAGTIAEIPASLSAALAAIRLTGKTPATTAPQGSSFAAGPGSDGRPAAGLALPQPGGACIYVTFRTIKATSKEGTVFSVTDGPTFTAWAAPTSAPCQGSAALAAGGFLTYDRYEGG